MSDAETIKFLKRLIYVLMCLGVGSFTAHFATVKSIDRLHDRVHTLEKIFCPNEKINDK